MSVCPKKKDIVESWSISIPSKCPHCIFRSAQEIRVFSWYSWKKLTYDKILKILKTPHHQANGIQQRCPDPVLEDSFSKESPIPGKLCLLGWVISWSCDSNAAVLNSHSTLTLWWLGLCKHATHRWAPVNQQKQHRHWTCVFTIYFDVDLTVE